MDSNLIEGSPSSKKRKLDESSPPSRRVCKYDVFLSFRGTDTRNTFTDHLYNHLTRKGIFTFMDEKRLEKGQTISSQLLQAIRDSRVSIVVFSKDYAGSTWCLEEMATIAECKDELEQMVFPIFYDVDPSDVRKQAGAYKDAFVLHTERFNEDLGKVDRWKRAMRGLASSAGWDLRDKPEFTEIVQIIHKVIKALNHRFSGSAEDLVGIQPRIEELNKLMKLSSMDDDFRVLGICGMGGIGKTTLATVLFDRISYQFDSCCFVENVSKDYKDGGATAIQRQILRRTLDEQNLDIYSPSEISNFVRNRLSLKKVLIVLDNVDELEQLENLAINPKLLGRGSRIIITTRNEHILKVFGADAIHKVPLLNENDARELFLRKAFKSDDPSCSSCVELIPKILEYVRSLPLAIKVVGSFLCTRNAIQWEDALDRLKRNPDKKITNVLLISYEGLQQEEKEIFLHIACFFSGEREDYVKQILDSCGLHPHIGIQGIIEKSLITIKNQEIYMHEMLQELGKKIVRKKYPEEPESWSRLWLYKDFENALMLQRTTMKVQAIVIDQKENVSECNQLKIEGLSKMKGLKFLILHHKNCSGILNILAHKLKYLFWHGYPFCFLPSFEPYCGLVELNLPNSSIKRLWEGRKSFAYLERVDLSNSKNLIETPNFEWSLNLRRLDLSGCTNLLKVHHSIGLLNKLAYLSLRNCSRLDSLDFGKCMLSSLIVLNLSGCTKLNRMPNFRGLSNLEYLDLEQCRCLLVVPESIVRCQKLKFFSLRDSITLHTMHSAIFTVWSLQTLDLRGCFIFGNIISRNPAFVSRSRSYQGSLVFLDLGFCNLSEVPIAIGELRCLERLNLQGNKIRHINIKSLSSLAYLNLAHCYELISITLPELPIGSASSMGRYYKTVSGSRNHKSGLYIFSCPNVTVKKCPMMVAFSWLARLIKQPNLFRCGFDIVIPVNENDDIPEWYFNHQFESGSIIRIVDSDVNEDWCGFAFCVTFQVDNNSTISNSSSLLLPYPLYLSFESEHTEESFHFPFCLDQDNDEHLRQFNARHGSSGDDGSMSKHSNWIIYISEEHCHFVKTGARIMFKACPNFKVHKWGLRMVFNQDTDPLKSWLQSVANEGDDKVTDLTKNWLKCVANRGDDKNTNPMESWLQSVANEGDDKDTDPLKRWLQSVANEGNDKVRLPNYRLVIEQVHESSSNTEPKILLPYNWFVNEQEENENLEAKEKENNLSNIGLSTSQLE